MKSGLEVQMKELMDEASLKELMPDFDQESLWPDVAVTLPNHQPKKRFPSRSMIAAAALLLAMISTYWVYQLMPSKKEAGLTTIAHSTVGTSSVQVVSAAVLPAQPTPGIVQSQSVVQQKTIASINTKHTVAVPVPNVSIQNTRPVIVLPSSSNNIAQAEPAIAPAVRKKVTHYLDLEDAAEAPKVAETSSPSLIQLKLNKPEFSTVGNTQKPFKEITFALGK